MLEPPKNIEIETEDSFAAGVHSKIREILLYLERSRLIPGKGIRFIETPCGIAVSAETDGRVATSIPIRRNKAASSEYAGPWSLYLDGGSRIHAKQGLIWTPGGTYASTPAPCGKPGESSLIVVEYSQGSALLSAILLDPEDPSVEDLIPWQEPSYWNTHAILGKYDKQTDKVIQYHFSPVVFMIETEDFVIEP